MYKADQNDITRLVASALDLASEKPLTMGEFAESILQSYMDQEPTDFVPLGDMHRQWEELFPSHDPR